jgi:hypothetical protein
MVCLWSADIDDIPVSEKYQVGHEWSRSAGGKAKSALLGKEASLKFYGTECAHSTWGRWQTR